MKETATAINKLFPAKGGFPLAFSSPEFYMELTFIGISILVAWLIALLIQRRTRNHFITHPPRRIDAEFILKPLSLLTPVLALLYLSIAKSLAENSTSGLWIEGAAQICVAYFFAKIVLLIIGRRAIGYFIAAVIMVIAILNVSGLMPSISKYLGGMAFGVGTFKISMLNLIHGGVILIIVFWLAAVMSRTLESYLRRSSSLSYNARELLVKFFKLFVYFLALIITLSALGIDLTAFAVFGGAVGVGIGLGLQKITANFISGITLLVERSIKLGDLIEVGDVFGWVRQLNVRYTLLETFDGREMMIPNEELTSTRVTNWTFSNTRARVEIKVGVGYGSNARLVKKLMLEAAYEHPLCLKEPEAKCWLRSFGDSSLNFEMVFWIPDIKEGRLGPQSDVMMALLDKFSANNIEIPFPQRVVYMKNG